MHHLRPIRDDIMLPKITPADCQSQWLALNKSAGSGSYTRGKSYVIEAVEERQPNGRQGVSSRLFIPDAELPVERIHGLGTGEALVVETIVARRDGNEETGECESPVEESKFGEDFHCENERYVRLRMRTTKAAS